MKKSLLLIMLFALLGGQAQAQGEKFLKRKVAIGRFSNETQYGKGLFYDRENDPMRKQALDILSAKLVQSEKFILLERDDLEILFQEGQMQEVNADFLILGSITQFGRKTEGHSGVFKSSKQQTAEAVVSVRLVDVSTGLIVYAEEAKGYAENTTKKVLGVGGSSNYDATLSEKAISAAISQLVENIINKCMDKPWRGYILSCDEGQYILSGGASQGIEKGDKFHVYQKGKKVKNPQTGMTVELPGNKVGELTVTGSYGDLPENEISFCSYQGGKIDLNNLDNYYVSEE